MQLSPAIEALPWLTIRPGYELKLVRGGTDDDTRVLLLRLAPGVEIARHRHSGEVHAFNLQGTRRLCTGEVIGPGGYVYEPPGNVDSWRAVGEVPVVVFITARGAMEYLDEADRVLERTTTATITARYGEGTR